MDLTGKVIKKPWVKSFESWNAGGSEYYVLDVGDQTVPGQASNGQSSATSSHIPQEQRSAREGVILRPSEAITFEDFRKYVGKRVIVTGSYLPGKPYKPTPGKIEQMPISMDPMTGETVYPIRGSGFRVDKITIIEDVQQ